jgi:uncharacterized protein (UPF0276 family)
VYIPGLASGVGLGWRTELAAPLLGTPRTADFIEVIAEACFDGAPMSREVLGLAEIWKGRVLPHGLKLSLGSADGIDVERARRLGALTRRLQAPVVSEHVAFTRGRSAEKRLREIGHLTQLPLTRTAVSVVAKNVDKARRHLPDVPFLLETPAWTLRWPDDEMDEGAFFGELVRATSCDLLVDLGNIYANAVNSQQDPLALLHSYPLSHVAMVHLAGGALRNGFYVDTHAHPVPAPVFSLLDSLLKVTGPLPIIIERDGNFPDFGELHAELGRARDCLTATMKTPPERPAPSRPRKQAVSEREVSTLAMQQGHLAELLTATEAPARTAPFDATAVSHSRSILQHKRLDEARYQSRFSVAPRPENSERRGPFSRWLFGRQGKTS